jgi:hypothetical protein
MAVLVHCIRPGHGTVIHCLALLTVPEEQDGEGLHRILKNCLLEWFDEAWWAARGISFAVDGASVLGASGGACRRRVADPDAPEPKVKESSVFRGLSDWMPFLHPLREPAHVVAVHVRTAFAGVASDEALADAVGLQRAFYLSTVMWKQLERVAAEVMRQASETEAALSRADTEVDPATGKANIPLDAATGKAKTRRVFAAIRAYPYSHRIRWAQADLIILEVHLRNLGFVVRHLRGVRKSALKGSKKEQTHMKQSRCHKVWEDARDYNLVRWGIFRRAVLQAANGLAKVSQSRELTGAHLTQAQAEFAVMVKAIKEGTDVGTKAFLDEVSPIGVWRGYTLSASAPSEQLVEDMATVISRLEITMPTDVYGVLKCTFVLNHGILLKVGGADEHAAWGNAALTQFHEDNRRLLRNSDLEIVLLGWADLKARYVDEFKLVTYKNMWGILEGEPTSPILDLLEALRTRA